jgi:hypothetical protein
MYLYADETGGINVQSVACKPAVLDLYVREWCAVLCCGVLCCAVVRCGVVKADERRTAVFTASTKNNRRDRFPS